MMKKPLIGALTLVALFVTVLLLPLMRPVQAQSAGCSAVSTLSGDYPATEAFNIGSSEFFAGDQINLAVTIDGPSDLRLLIEGPVIYDVTSGNPQSYIIPSNGFYNVTVENTLAQTIPGVSVSCIPSGVEVTEDPDAQTGTQGFFQTQDAVSTIVAQTQAAVGTSAAETQIAGATQTTIWNLVTQTAVTGQNQTATQAFVLTQDAAATSMAQTQAADMTQTAIWDQATQTAVTGQTQAAEYTPPAATATPSPEPWPGLTDGRLNPAIDEPFSLWCANNLLNIYRSVNGQGQLLATYPLTGLRSRAVESVTTITTGSGPLTLTRLNDELYTISGSIGTNAPAFGVKQFSLAACILANGGLTVPTQTPTRAPSLTPSLTPSVTPVGFTATATSQPSSIASLLFGAPVTSANDSDGDGIRNLVDLCPAVYAPAPLQFGCPDSDSDGLSDPLDHCPREPGPAGSRIGCPDYDGDGFIAQDDYCPFFAPSAENGIAFGCADGDRDGYPNALLPNWEALDWCPQRGRLPNVTHWMGCPDPDNDGLIAAGPLIPDGWVDPCPLSPLPAYEDGTCQDQVQFTPIVVNTAPALFQFANSVGAFDNLVLEGYDSSESCSKFQLYYGTCFSGNDD